MNTMLITTEYNPGGENEREEWDYRLHDGVWQVRGPDEDDWEDFAEGTASEETVRQLLRKDHSELY